MPNSNEVRIPKEKFAVDAIKKLRKGSYKGIHTVFSGFNSAWKEYYGDDPVIGVNKLVEAHVITGHPAKGGFTIGLPEDAPNAKDTKLILNKILMD